MKTKYWLLAVCVTACAGGLNAQTINWSGLAKSDNAEHTNILNLEVGWDYAASVGLGYSYIIKTRVPLALNVQITIPAGNDLLDDYKIKLGGQARVYKTGNFITTVSVHGLFRRYRSDMAAISSFGGEFVGLTGYYRPRWFIAGEFGFDKAIATHITHSDWIRENFPGARDGWYVPTGGNFLFGIQGGYTIKNIDVYLQVRKILDQRFDSTLLIPFGLQLGTNVKF